MLDVGEYAKAVLPGGTTAIVTDLHEIANVCGMAGIRHVLYEARSLPIELFLMAPSCVPASRLDTAGASLTPADIQQILGWKGVIGLGEVMNFAGVIGADIDVLAKIRSAEGRVVDGHAPMVSGNELNAYIAAGIHSDHESVSLDEAREKLRLGMWIMIREGTSEKNLEALLPLVTDMTYKRCLFVVDDRSCIDLYKDGDIDALVRKAIRLGLEPVRAIQLATINAAEYFRLQRLGAIAPGYLANLVVVGDLAMLKIDMVFHRGRLVAEGGESLFTPRPCEGKGLTGTIHVKPFAAEALGLKAGDGNMMPVIEIVPGQIITRKRMERVRAINGEAVPDTSRDILKLVVVERHRKSGNIGVGLVKGFGLKQGAIASSIAHDSHNIVAAGTCDSDIYAAIREVERLDGGLVITIDGKVISSLPLPIAGLMSDRPLQEVAESLERLISITGDMGSALLSPFATLSFLSLPVIPAIRLTDLGLVDVLENRLI
jgi:adenine deaminase